jgi:mRNA interferase RelE/StbE
MKLNLTKQALKFWGTLDKKQQQQIGQKVISLMMNARPSDSEALSGAKGGERRVDVGEYRIIYTHDSEVVNVLIIGKRNGDEVYKLWKQMQ